MLNEKQILSKAFELINSYRDELSQENNLVVNYLPPSELKQKLELKIENKGVTWDKLFELIQDYLTYSVDSRSKQFFNQLYSGSNQPAFIGEIFTALTNASMYTYEVAPVASVIELEVINKMCGIAGFADGDGVLLTGGSNANLVAMFSARNRFSADIKSNGVYNHSPLTAFVSEQSHYSLVTAANLLGIGAKNVIRVKSDKNGRLLSASLEDEILKSIDRGEKPFFVTGTAATTLHGAYDPFVEIAAIAKKYDMWFHVDGSFGGSLILSKTHRHLFAGLEFADSFVWNPHKLMNIPLICSALLVKKKGTLQNNFIDLQTDYIFHESESESYDLGKKSLQCGRRVDALKLWLAWKYFGDEGYEKRINKLMEIANYFAECVIKSADLELLAERQSLTVCFRYKPKTKTDINEFNINLRNKLRTSGKSIINYGYIGDKVAIRFINPNPDVDKSDIDKFFENLFETVDNMMM